MEKFVDASAAFDALAPEWDALDAQLSPRTPYTSPIWFRLWWCHLRRRGILTRDELFLHALRDQRDQLIAIAPLMITHKPGFGPFRLRLLQFIGADPSITEVRGLICRPEHQTAVVRALIEHLSDHRSEWDVLLWSGLRKFGLETDLPHQLGRLNKDDTLPCYVLDLPQTWDEVVARLSSNTRKSVRKSYEYLMRDGYRFVFRSQSRPEDAPAALERFFSLHAARSLATDMKTHPDRWSGHKHRIALVADFAREMAKRGDLHMLQLEIDGVVVATRIAYRLGDDLYLYYSGFDPKWRKYSVMTTLTAETIKWAIESGMRRVNLSTGTDLGKLRWRPIEILYYNKRQTSPTLRGRFMCHIYDLLTAWRTDGERQSSM